MLPYCACSPSKVGVVIIHTPRDCSDQGMFTQTLEMVSESAGYVIRAMHVPVLLGPHVDEAVSHPTPKTAFPWRHRHGVLYTRGFDNMY